MGEQAFIRFMILLGGSSGLGWLANSAELVYTFEDGCMLASPGWLHSRLVVGCDRMTGPCVSQAEQDLFTQ